MDLTSQVIKEADDLQQEKDRDKFFAKYTSINTALEEKFIELLLFLDGQKYECKGLRYSIDFSSVFNAVRDLELQKANVNSELICVWL